MGLFVIQKEYDWGRFRPFCAGNRVRTGSGGDRVNHEQRAIQFSKSAFQPRAERPAGDEISAYRSSGKYQVTRNSQLSTFGLTFQMYEIYEMYEEGEKRKPVL